MAPAAKLSFGQLGLALLFTALARRYQRTSCAHAVSIEPVILALFGWAILWHGLREKDETDSAVGLGFLVTYVPLPLAALGLVESVPVLLLIVLGCLLVARAMANEDRLSSRIAFHEKDMKQWEEASERVMKKGDEEGAREMVRRLEQAERQRDRLREELRTQSEETEEIREAITRMHDRLQKARLRLELLQAQMRQGEATAPLIRLWSVSSEPTCRASSTVSASGSSSRPRRSARI